MIPFTFSYWQPQTLQEAVDAYVSCAKRGEKPLYYGGGTEIITMGRVNSLKFDAVIDLKNIPELSGLNREGNRLVLGAAETLTSIARWNAFPLLSRCCARVADHTAQCKITLGGNIAGTIIYHEAVLPLLLAGATAELYGPEGARAADISALFSPGLNLLPGEFFVRLSLDAGNAGLPFVHAKHVDSEKIGYPLFTLAAILKKDIIMAAVSGLFPYPALLIFPAANTEQDPALLEKQLNDQLPGQPLSDVLGSGEYRLFRLKQALGDMISRLKEDAH